MEKKKGASNAHCSSCHDRSFTWIMLPTKYWNSFSIHDVLEHCGQSMICRWLHFYCLKRYLRISHSSISFAFHAKSTPIECDLSHTREDSQYGRKLSWSSLNCHVVLIINYCVISWYAACSNENELFVFWFIYLVEDIGIDHWTGPVI